MKEEIEGNRISSRRSKPHHQTETAGNYRTVKKITKHGSRTSWKRLEANFRLRLSPNHEEYDKTVANPLHKLDLLLLIVGCFRNLSTDLEKRMP